MISLKEYPIKNINVDQAGPGDSRRAGPLRRHRRMITESIG